MGFQLSLFLLAFAVSLDNFSTGFTYGLRKLRIPNKSILIIALCSGVSLFVAMLFGNILQKFMSPEIGNRIGGIILIAIGGWVLFQFFRAEKEVSEPQEKVVLKLEIRSLGFVIHILKKPTSADFDKSGVITGIEAFMLGLALSLDAFGAGIGAAMLGYSPISLSLIVAIMSLILVSAGIKLGKVFSHLNWMQKVSFLPGVLLILIGILKF
ncbi:sporulation membrane protein YtaF [Bacillus sp. FJAT-49736]|uniref:sporulation membrane protein YtaF n=1 Tax=Bacillus sp. FJAT-49736 TaxID=2833582 RepID=UPI001BCA5484|nr:sporulation membrane protein YtaF [Bacillus sp. FJAT-49736]MBS4173786.1 sporulation membrane protein YtaF [Bacillus sp. FJAT-49736]